MKKIVYGGMLLIAVVLICLLASYNNFKKETQQISQIVSTLFPSFIKSNSYFSNSGMRLINFGAKSEIINREEVNLLTKYPINILKSDSGINIVLIKHQQKSSNRNNFVTNRTIYNYLLRKDILLYYYPFPSLLEYFWNSYPRKGFFYINGMEMKNERKMKLYNELLSLMKEHTIYDKNGKFINALLFYSEEGGLTLVKYEPELGDQLEVIDSLLNLTQPTSAQIFNDYGVDSAYLFMNFPKSFGIKKPLTQ